MLQRSEFSLGSYRFNVLITIAILSSPRHLLRATQSYKTGYSETELAARAQMAMGYSAGYSETNIHYGLLRNQHTN